MRGFSINAVDILVSWNFKHIVNVKRIRGYNAVNMKLGYPTIGIRSPKEIIYNEDYKKKYFEQRRLKLKK